MPSNTTASGSDLIIKCALKRNSQGVNLIEGDSLFVYIIESSLVLDSEFVSPKASPTGQ